MRKIAVFILERLKNPFNFKMKIKRLIKI